ncbi:TylF/MycF family methyltransferase [archaeon]|nr:TylF/MycF family methyltransferase [archaeon]
MKFKLKELFYYTLPSPKYKLIKTILGYLRFEKLRGDWLEFGTYEGNSTILTMRLADKYKVPLRIITFDSFEGMPLIKSKLKIIKKGKFKTNYQIVKSNLKQYETDDIKVEVVKGYYKDTCNKQLVKHRNIKKISVLYIDCDIYESTKQALDFATPYLQNGSIIVFDEFYGWFTDYKHSEYKAFKEWQQNNPNFELVEFHKFGNVHNSFILLIKEK